VVDCQTLSGGRVELRRVEVAAVDQLRVEVAGVDPREGPVVHDASPDQHHRRTSTRTHPYP